MPRKSEYKPLLFTTTMRNPHRLRGLLGIFAAYDGKILDDALATKIVGEVIKAGLYTPNYLSATVSQKRQDKQPLTNREIAKILKDNPQNHKEAGFSKGWASRFDTLFKLAKELGFVFYQSGGKIEFSEAGLMLVKCAEFERGAFLNAFVKYQSNNPFRRVLNENVPLILLLQVIEKLKSDSETNDAGISKLELPLVLYWKDNDAEKLYLRIKKLREEFGYNPSWEVIIEIYQKEIMEGRDKKRTPKSIMRDYTDEFIRKMRLTELITLRGSGRFIDTNENERKKIKYVLRKYSHYEKYDSEKSYFNHISTIDKKLFSLREKVTSRTKKEKFLNKWAEFYAWNTIKSEMLNLSAGQKDLSKDGTLKYLSPPVRLEFLTALAIRSRFPKIRVIPNYPVDDEGLPTFTAGGNGGDIECFEGTYGILIEVTMLEGRAQTMAEIWPICDHLINLGKNVDKSMCYFVAPSIFRNSIRQIRFVRHDEGVIISPWTIREFVECIEKMEILYDENIHPPSPPR